MISQAVLMVVFLSLNQWQIIWHCELAYSCVLASYILLKEILEVAGQASLAVS